MKCEGCGTLGTNYHLSTWWCDSCAKQRKLEPPATLEGYVGPTAGQVLSLTAKEDASIKELLQKVAAQAEGYTCLVVVALHKDGPQRLHSSSMNLSEHALALAVHQAHVMGKFNIVCDKDHE